MEPGHSECEGGVQFLQSEKSGIPRHEMRVDEAGLKTPASLCLFPASKGHLSHRRRVRRARVGSPDELSYLVNIATWLGLIFRT